MFLQSCPKEGKGREESPITDGEDITPLEQIMAAWEQYMEVLARAGMSVSPACAIQLSELADQLA